MGEQQRRGEQGPDERALAVPPLSFFELFVALVLETYRLPAHKRVGTVKPKLVHYYGSKRSDVFERIENHVLRTVSWIEEFEDDDSLVG